MIAENQYTRRNAASLPYLAHVHSGSCRAAVPLPPHSLGVTHVNGFLLHKKRKHSLPLPDDVRRPTNSPVFLIAQLDASHRSGSWRTEVKLKSQVEQEELKETFHVKDLK